MYYAALTYLILGLASGVFYREYTKIVGFDTGQYTQLSTLHTHLLALGFLFMLIVLALDKVFDLSSSTTFYTFFWTYNAGMAVTITMMVVHGIMAVGGSSSNGMTAGIAGLGHILLTFGLVSLMMSLGGRVKEVAARK
ncbi:DUF2871 domain-containing protein [Brevibacterium paucivorans]